MPLLEVKNLKVSFRGDQGFLPVVRGVSLSLEPGETLAVVGESGSGKSVTTLAVMGLLDRGARVEGEFLFDDQPFSPQSGRLRGHGLSMIFQNPMSSLNPVMSVGKQVAEPLLLAHCKKEEAETRVMALFSEVGLPSTEDFYRAYPHRLSGGMRQRVMIAIALACEPKVLLADEPTTALDVTIQAQILELLGRIQTKREMALILVTHDMSVVESVADRVAVMYAGQFVEVGATELILSSPRHPYTEALLQSIPRLDGKRPERLRSIPGRPPSPGEVGAGCPFAPRCSRVEEMCRAEVPELLETGAAERAVRCLLAEERTS